MNKEEENAIHRAARIALTEITKLLHMPVSYSMQLVTDKDGRITCHIRPKQEAIDEVKRLIEDIER